MGTSCRLRARKASATLAVERVGIVVANPEFEQITQHIEGIGLGGIALEKRTSAAVMSGRWAHR